MSVNITIKVSGVAEVLRDYEKFRFDMKNNMIVPINESAQQYLKVINTNFQDYGKTFGKKWDPLSKATIAEKRELYKQGKSIAISKPLVRTGKMQKGFTRRTQGKNTAYIFNTQDYAILHQEERTAIWNGRPVTIPQRVIAAVDDERVNMVANIFVKWFNSIVNKNKL